MLSHMMPVAPSEIANSLLGHRSRAEQAVLPASQQLIRIDVDGNGDVFGKRQLVECFADKAA